MAESQRRKIDLLGDTVAYEVRRSSDAMKPRIDVDIHGVMVVVPESEAVQPAELLKENAAWVINKKRKYEAYQKRIPERRFEAGAKFPYLGEQHEIITERRSSSAVIDGTFRLAEHHVEDTSVKRALETLYRRKARETF